MFVSVQFNLEFENNQEREKVLALVRLQSFAIRFIYSRLKEYKKEKESYDLTRKPVRLLSLYISYAVQKLKGVEGK